MKYYYIYLIKFETGEVYIGSRQSKVPPEQDTKYWGSPKTYKHLWENTSLKKEKFIIKECDGVEELREIEPKLIKAGWEKYGDKCLNRHASPVFHPEVSIKGGLRSKELKSGIHKLTKEERVMYGKIGGEPKIREFTVRSPSGEIIFGKNINQFCRDNNLYPSNFCNLLNGKVKSCKGWTLPETSLFGENLFVWKVAREFLIKSPDGEIIKSKNVTKFCNDNKLQKSKLYEVFNGKRKHHKGWTLP